MQKRSKEQMIFQPPIPTKSYLKTDYEPEKK